MNSSDPTNQIRRSTAEQSDGRRVLLFLFAIAGILTARWIWIAGLGDYAWTYEFGMRVLFGEVPYRDFISTLPQLTSYSIVPFLFVLKGNLWAFSLHLYLWWLAALLVGLQVARVLGVRPAAQAAAMFLAACVSLPAMHLGHAYSYAGTVFFGLTFLQLLQHRQNQSARHLLLAGTCAGLAVFAKQNIGVISVILGLSVIAWDGLANQRCGGMFRNGLLFAIGVLVAALPIFAYFASQAGAGEVLQQMFLDAGAGKGGLPGMIFHVLPLFFFTPETPLQKLWTLAFSGSLTLCFLWLVGRRMLVLQETQTGVPTSIPVGRAWRWISFATVTVAVLSCVSVLDLPQVRAGFNRLHPSAIYEFHGFVAPLVFIAYVFFTALAAICLLSPFHWRQPNFALPIIALPMILWGHELSCEGYLPFGAPLVVPLAVFLLEGIGLIRNTVPLACLAGVVFMLGVTGSTQDGFHPPSFKAVARLPSASKFRGLWGRPTYVATIQELQENVAPRIRDRRTLWLAIGGPHLAWGGVPVYSVAALFGDTYSLRSEPVLMKHWTAQPPEFIFVGERNICLGSGLLTAEALNFWLPRKYDLAWKSAEREAALWQLRAATNTVSH